MGKASRRKREARERFSTLNEHERRGRIFIPPLMQIPKWKFSSWHAERLPEMAWAVLLISCLERQAGLDVFRSAAKFIEGLDATDKIPDVTLSGLGKLPESRREAFIELITKDKSAKLAMSPLLVLDGLPARSSWEKHLDSSIPPQEAWQALAKGVLVTLDHQSQESTDCRWMRVLAMLLSEKLKLPSLEAVKEILEYPMFGDMRKVRPSIRATEIGFPMEPAEWPENFWKQCMIRTPCSSMVWTYDETPRGRAALSSKGIATAWLELKLHFHNSILTTAPDARHDTAFGIGFYALALAGEILRGKMEDSVSGRLVLRTLVECNITLAYLLKLDDPETWKAFRAYGAGQAKLAFLKSEESGNPAASVDVARLQQLANEDVWMEFLPVDIGHWEGSNLREISIKAGAKETYDRFYSWTSNFTHGHWAAVRESVFDTCANPLHRFHRVPRVSLNQLPNVSNDAAQVVDAILELIMRAYPGKGITLVDGGGGSSPPEKNENYKSAEQSGR